MSTLARPEDVLAAMDCGLFRSADGRFGFRHDLLREAVVADLEDARRSLHHETLGRALRASPAEAARHLRLAGRDDLAAERLVEAAAAAVRATALVEAAALPDRGGRAAPRRRRHRSSSSPTCSPSSGGASRRWPRCERALALLEPPMRRPPDAHRRAALWFRGPLCDPGRARRSAQHGIEALDAGAARTRGRAPSCC